MDIFFCIIYVCVGPKIWMKNYHMANLLYQRVPKLSHTHIKRLNTVFKPAKGPKCSITGYRTSELSATASRVKGSFLMSQIFPSPPRVTTASSVSHRWTTGHSTHPLFVQSSPRDELDIQPARLPWATSRQLLWKLEASAVKVGKCKEVKVFRDQSVHWTVWLCQASLWRSMKHQGQYLERAVDCVHLSKYTTKNHSHIFTLCVKTWGHVEEGHNLWFLMLKWQRGRYWPEFLVVSWKVVVIPISSRIANLWVLSQ